MALFFSCKDSAQIAKITINSQSTKNNSYKNKKYMQTK